MNILDLENVGVSFCVNNTFEWFISNCRVFENNSCKWIRSDVFRDDLEENFDFCMQCCVTSSHLLLKMKTVHRDPTASTIHQESFSDYKCKLNVKIIEGRFIITEKNDIIREGQRSIELNKNLFKNLKILITLCRLTDEVSCIACGHVPPCPNSKMSGPSRLGFKRNALERYGLFSSDNRLLDLQSRMSAVLNSDQAFDLTLHVEGKELRVYRGILAAASPVFTSMLMCYSSDVSKSDITIHDVSFEIFSQMIKYIYTGEIDLLSTQQYLKLIQLALKYVIPGLKRMCFDMLKNDMQTLVICSLLNIAAKYKDEELIDITISEIKKQQAYSDGI